MKFILNESKKFLLEEQSILNEGAALDTTNHANIIKFYPGSELRGSGFWKEIKLPDVSEFNKYLKKALNDYFGAKWITKEQCDELIKIASENKNDQGPVHKKFQEFEKDSKQQTSTPKDEVSTFGEISDWVAAYAKAVDKKAIIEAYIYEIWPEEKDAKKVKLIATAFENECVAYNFNKDKNPFISFISNIYLNPSYDISVDTYNVIHNQVSKGNLRESDLIIDPSNKNNDLQEANLLRCKNFYKLDTNVMKLYIQKQASLRQVDTDNMQEGIKSTKELVYKVLYVGTADLGVSGDVKLSSVDKDLNNFPTIETLEQRFTGTVSDLSIDSPNKKVKAPKISAPAIIKAIGNTDNAVKVLATLAIKFSSNDEITNLINNCTKVSTYMSQNATLKSIQSLVASIERLYGLKTITADNAKDLTKSILEAEDFELN